MKSKNSNKIIQSLLLALSFLLISSFSGCTNQSEEKESDVNVSVTTLQIEIVKNENAHEIKVQAKVNDVNQSKSYYYDYNIKSEYDPNSEPANKDASIRVKPRSAIDANMHIRSPYEKVQVSLLVRKMSKKFIVKCSACHNDYANGIIGPSLLGRNTDYIYNKIADFKSGKKSNPLMSDLIKMMSNEEIKEMAQEIYDFNQEIEQMRNK